MDGSVIGTAQDLSDGTASLNVADASAGTHSVTATYTPAGGAKYSESTSASLNETVNPASLVVKSSNMGGTYGGKLPSFAWTADFVAGDTASSLTTQPTCTATANTASGKIGIPAGTYPIACGGASDPNHYISYAAGVLTVGSARLVIKATSASEIYGGRAPSLTWTATFSNGDSARSLTTQPTCETTARPPSGGITISAGRYLIACWGAPDPNYYISYAAGTLTVGSARLVIKATSASEVYGGKAPSLTWTAAFANGDNARSLTTQPTCNTMARPPSGGITSAAG